MMPPISQFKRLDIRPIIREGGDPCQRIFSKVDQLQPEEGLLLHAPFLPTPLIERLRGQGFACKLERGRGTDWLVYFWRE
jgi:hypothetical protein